MVKSVGVMTAVAQKYLPLMNYLCAFGNPAITLTFTHIERIIGSEIPASALRRGNWWANNPGHSNADAWLNAGREVADVNYRVQTVTFTRLREDE
jgi:hypothetical protein